MKANRSYYVTIPFDRAHKEWLKLQIIKTSIWSTVMGSQKNSNLCFKKLAFTVKWVTRQKRLWKLGVFLELWTHCRRQFLTQSLSELNLMFNFPQLNSRIIPVYTSLILRLENTTIFFDRFHLNSKGWYWWHRLFPLNFSRSFAMVR